MYQNQHETRARDIVSFLEARAIQSKKTNPTATACRKWETIKRATLELFLTRNEDGGGGHGATDGYGNGIVGIGRTAEAGREDRVARRGGASERVARRGGASERTSTREDDP